MNQDIVTSLKNAVEHGESLQIAMQIMVNSGYNSQEVQEASKYVSQGVTPELQLAPQEQLTMPGKPKKEKKKSFFSKLNPFKKKLKSPQQESLQTPVPTSPHQIQQQSLQPIHQQPKTTQPLPQLSPQSPVQPIQSIPQTQQNQPLAKQLKKIKPTKKSYIKEIILLFILIILIGILIATIVFRDNILRFFSG